MDIRSYSIDALKLMMKVWEAGDDSIQRVADMLSVGGEYPVDEADTEVLKETAALLGCISEVKPSNIGSQMGQMHLTMTVLEGVYALGVKRGTGQ